MKTAVALLVMLAVAASSAQAAPRTVQQKMVAYALREARRNVQEIPAHSNTGPDIRRYHAAVRHAKYNDWWCTIFVSYVAMKAGYPLGSRGQGIVKVRNLYFWGRRTGFFFPVGARRPKPGDIAVHGYGHAGVVIRVARSGQVYTVDGNWSDSVHYQRNPPFSTSGYIRLPSTPRTA